MPLYAGKYAICTFLQNMRNMLRSHVRYKPVSLYVKPLSTYSQFKLQFYLLKFQEIRQLAVLNIQGNHCALTERELPANSITSAVQFHRQIRSKT